MWQIPHSKKDGQSMGLSVFFVRLFASFNNSVYCSRIHLAFPRRE